MAARGHRTRYYPSPLSRRGEQFPQAASDAILVLTELQYRILKRIKPVTQRPEVLYSENGKLAALLGDSVFAEAKGKTVLDFGCGNGLESIELARRGAARVLGIDIRENAVERARHNARLAGVHDICKFGVEIHEKVDLIVSIDCFEHFSDPAAILTEMCMLLKPGGAVFVSFGPTWYHPFGGHLFSVFPWAHLIFSEEALICWRNDIRTDGATRFSEVEGGLNQMTIRRFEHLVRGSSFRIDFLEAAPIRAFRFIHNRLTREWTTSIVRCKLVKKVRTAQRSLNAVK